MMQMAAAYCVMLIDNLATHPHHLHRLARWHHRQWSHLTGDLTLAQRKRNLLAHIDGKPLPVTFIAMEQGELIASLCLVENDLKSDHGYTPWLSRIIVQRRWRRKAVAYRLIDHGLQYIRQIGFNKIYLLTEHQQSFFSHLGWREIDNTTLNGYPVSIMEITLKK